MGKQKTSSPKRAVTAAELLRAATERYRPPEPPPAAIRLVRGVLKGNAKVGLKRRVSSLTVLEVLHRDHGVTMGLNTFERWVAERFKRRSWGQP